MIKKIAISIVSFLIVICLFSSIVITQENEYKLIREFGKVSSVITEPGISFKIAVLQTADTLASEILFYE